MAPRIAAVIVCLLLAAIGCASVTTETYPDPRGSTIPVTEVPEGVMKELNRHNSGETLHSVERIGDGTLFRFEMNDGAIHLIDRNGKYQMGII